MEWDTLTEVMDGDGIKMPNTIDYRRFKNVVEPGNIDLKNRPIVHNADGTISTEKSFSIGTDKGETLIPQVVGGKMLSQQDAIQHYKDTGEHLGIFKDVSSANTAAEAIHNRGQPMARNDEDALTAAQKRALRTGRSFFPAANYPQGQIIQGSGAGGARVQGYGGFGPNQGLLPPDQNPAYQAAIARNPTPASRYAAARSTPTNIGTYQGMYGPDTVVSTGPNTFRTYSSQRGYIGRSGNAANYLASQQGVPTAPAAAAPAYGPQVGFSILNNVPSSDLSSSLITRPPETPVSPLTTSERIGRTAFNVLNIPRLQLGQVSGAAASLGRGIYGIGRDIYGGFTGQRTPQPPPSEMGAGSTPALVSSMPNPWGNFTQRMNYGLPGRYFDPNYNQ